TKSRVGKMAGLLCESKVAGLGSERQRNGDRARVGAGRIGHGRPGRHSKTGCLFEAETEFPIRPRQCQKIRGSGADECGTFRPDLNYPGIISAEAGEGFIAGNARTRVTREYIAANCNMPRGDAKETQGIV